MSRIQNAKRGAEHVRIDAVQAKRRIDNFLMSRCGDLPRSRVYQMIRKGEVRVNGGRIDAKYRLQEGDDVRIPPVSEAQAPDPSRIPERAAGALERVLHEDADLIVFNKPPGMAVHSGTGVSYGVIDILRRFHPAGKHLQLVHRLDRDTSGCLLLAKNLAALQRLHGLLRDGKLSKQYVVLLRGALPGGEISVDVPVDAEARRHGKRHVEVAEEGKFAHTRFKLIRQIGDAAFAIASISTGRTHQIRVHAAHLGYPVAGDRKYGNAAFNAEMRRMGLRRLFLHASRLRVPRPGKPELKIEAPMAEDLAGFLARYEEASSTLARPGRAR